MEGYYNIGNNIMAGVQGRKRKGPIKKRITLRREMLRGGIVEYYF